MGFSYDSPGNSPTDELRFLLGDTVSTKKTPHLFDDEELAWCILQEDSPRLAAALAADSAVAKYARQPTSKTLGETSITFGNLTNKFRELAAHLREQHRNDASPTPWSPGADAATPYMPIAVPLTQVPEVTGGSGTT